MPLPTVNRSPLADIVRAVLAGLAQYAGVPKSRVKLWRSDADLPPLADADNDLVVQVSGPVPDEPVVIGAGRVDTRITRHVTVTARTRCELDELSTAQVRLLDANLGHYALEEAVIDAMQMLDFQDKQGNQLLVQPIRLVPSQGARAVPRSAQWTATALVFEVVYEAALDQARQ